MSCEHGETPKVDEKPKTPVDTFRATRQFERFMETVRGQASEGEGVENGGGETVTILHYDKEKQQVTITYPDQEEPASRSTS